MMNIETKMLIQLYEADNKGNRESCIEAMKGMLPFYEKGELSQYDVEEHKKAIEILASMTDEEFHAIDYSDLPINVLDPLDIADYGDGIPDED